MRFLLVVLAVWSGFVSGEEINICDWMPENRPINNFPQEVYNLDIHTYDSEPADVELEVPLDYLGLQLAAVSFRYDEANSLMAMIVKHDIEEDNGKVISFISPKYFAKARFIVTYEKTGIRCEDVEMVVERQQYAVPFTHNK